MKRAQLATAVVTAWLLVHAATGAHADIEGDQFSSQDWRIEMSIPNGWTVTEKTSYPNVLLWMVHHNPRGKMLLTAELLNENITAEQYAERTSKLLTALGFNVGALQVHASTQTMIINIDTKGMFLKQAFLTDAGIGYSLTMSASSDRELKQFARAFDFALRSVAIDRSKRDTPSVDGEGDTDPPGGTEPGDVAPAAADPDSAGPATELEHE